MENAINIRLILFTDITQLIFSSVIVLRANVIGEDNESFTLVEDSFCNFVFFEAVHLNIDFGWELIVLYEFM